MLLKKRVVWFVSFILGFSIVVSPALSPAAGKAEAKRHFENGLAMMELEDFDGAAVEFEASLAFYTSQNATFNLAMCYKALHKYPKALEMFRKILKKYGKTMSPDDRKEVKKNIKLISKMVGKIEINTNVPKVIVLIDGEKVGSTPLEAPVSVGAGEHRVRVSREGYQGQEKLVAVVAGKSKVVAFTLEEGSAKAAPVVAIPAGPTPEQLEVEAIIGGNLSRDYIRYTRSGADDKESFAQYEYGLAKKQRKNGIILMAAIAPIVMGVGVGIYVACIASMDTEDIADPNYDDVVARNDALRGVGIFFISLAGAGSLVTLIVGSVRVGRGHTKMKKLTPLLKEDTVQGANIRFVGFSPLVDHNGIPGGASMRFSF